MVKDSNNRLVTAILKQIEAHRNGEQVDGSMIKSILDSMGELILFHHYCSKSGRPICRLTHPASPVALGLEDEQQHGKDNKTHTEVYREHFQKAFLTATENYYKAESEAFLAENSISDYLRLAEKRLKEEETRVNAYMHNQTAKPVCHCDNEREDGVTDQDSAQFIAHVEG